MKNVLTYIIISISWLSTLSQNSNLDAIKALEGIWVAEDYYNSFNQTKSSIASKNSFDPNHPVGLRINSKEVNDNKINIGYSKLHDHYLHPEVSGYVVISNDTIYEQGSFEIDLTQNNNSEKKIKTSPIDFFSDDSTDVSFLKWEYKRDTSLILYKYNSISKKEETIKYKRISKIFCIDNQFPNPLYYYTRKTIFEGEFILLDSLNNVLSDNFKIECNGKTKNINLFPNKTIYYSTDIYCGFDSKDDQILICSNNITKLECEGYIIKFINETEIGFYDYYWKEDPVKAEEKIIKSLIYRLKRK